MGKVRKIFRQTGSYRRASLNCNKLLQILSPAPPIACAIMIAATIIATATIIFQSNIDILSFWLPPSTSIDFLNSQNRKWTKSLRDGLPRLWRSFSTFSKKGSWLLLEKYLLLSYHTKQNTQESSLPMKRISSFGCFHKQFYFSNAPPW